MLAPVGARQRILDTAYDLFRRHGVRAVGVDRIVAEVERRGTAPAERMLAIFDVFGEWFQLADYEGCSFINVLLEFDDRGSAVRQASAGHLRNIRSFVSG